MAKIKDNDGNFTLDPSEAITKIQLLTKTSGISLDEIKLEQGEPLFDLSNGEGKHLHIGTGESKISFYDAAEIEAKIDALYYDTTRTSEDYFAYQVTQEDGKIEVKYTQPAATNVSYSNEDSELDASTVQDAIDAEVLARSQAIDNLANDLAGGGRTDETIKGNADAIAQEKADREAAITFAIEALDSNSAEASSGSFLTYVELVDGKFDTTKTKTASNAATATKFNSQRTIKLTGSVTGEGSSDGDSGWEINNTECAFLNMGNGDTTARTQGTTPDLYNGILSFTGLRSNTAIGSPSDTTYSYVLGLRGWSDNSGGKSHELAFNDKGIYVRTGEEDSWDGWNKFVTADSSGNATIPGTITANNITATGQVSADVAIGGKETYTDYIFYRDSDSTTTPVQPLCIRLDNTGGVTITNKCTAESFNAKSDARLKENFQPLKPEKSILDLPTYKFDFINGNKNQIGCKAQDLQEICPEIVNEGNDGYLSIQESKIVYLLLEEVKKLRKEIDELKR